MAAELRSSDLMKLYDNYEAPLEGGSYRFVLQQTVTVEGEKARHYYRDQRFEVLAPRYSIEPDEIQAYFPPAGGVAEYQNVLPHLVLRARNLPWERKLSPDSGREPWLGLLVLSERDIANGNVFERNGTVVDLEPLERLSDVKTDWATVEHWTRFQDGEEVLLPRFARREDANTPVRLLDLDLELFLKLCPRLKELPLLVHIRHVDPSDKVPLEMVADGEFSVLVANRFPQKGSNTVHLISLEGWDKLLGSPPKDPLPAPRVRLITLASWTFVCDGGGHDTFAGLMQRLRNTAAVFGVALPAPSESNYVNEALAKGYVPIDYKPLESTPTMAWYRGPLSPLSRGRMGRSSFQRADEALIFDGQTGIMDVSYAAAWELGRLLALGSPAFAKGLRLFVEQHQNAAEFARQIESFLTLHRSAFGGADPSVPEKEEIAIADDLIEWLARLVMLYPVPFHYLVPHPYLLPSESIRFFQLDDNWVDALLDGALSIAAKGVPEEDLTSRANLHATLSKIVYQHRLRLQGKNPQWNPSEQYMEIQKSGFLLRSSVVTGWPGVEVTATTNAELDQNLPNILRFDQISEGVLFCLARGSIKQVVFREPREGLTFGVGSEENVSRRSDALEGVVDISALGQKLGCTGSAQFAVKMIRKPEEQTIEWS